MNKRTWLRISVDNGRLAQASVSSYPEHPLEQEPDAYRVRIRTRRVGSTLVVTEMATAQVLASNSARESLLGMARIYG
ncbi:MAG: hypothetical protein HYU02_04535 [Thaumarchaeota archaeon]|nr:hypothetical protein [Nitrososphaerota archaeon]